jgi:hypothetical protein
MDDLGYLYVLANSAMPGLVKIGKTTRSPSERATELSGATGLPTPFIVVYEQLFRDCNAAEAFVHTYLERKGFRVADNREFFNAPVNDVVRAIVLAPDAIEGGVQQVAANTDSDELLSGGIDELDSLTIDVPAKTDAPPWESVFREAIRYYYGIGECIQDYSEALQLFRQAAKLGCIAAYARIGIIHEKGEGVREDKVKALDYYKEGARKGNVFCYFRMGIMFSYSMNYDNANKAFALFIKCNPNDGNLSIEEFQDIAQNVGGLVAGHFRGISMPMVLNTFIFLERSRFIASALEMEDLVRSGGDSKMGDLFSRIRQYFESLTSAEAPTI